MALTTYKVLAQANPSANTLTTLYTVPASTSTVASSIVVCNQTNTSIAFRISIAPAAAADATSQYLYYDMTVRGNQTFIATIGATLAATAVVRVMSSASSTSFNLFGVEIS